MLQEHITPFFNILACMCDLLVSKENGMGFMIGEKCDVILTLLDF